MPKVLSGIDGIKAAYQQALNEAKLDVICLSTEYQRVLGSYFEDMVEPKLHGGQLTLREILPRNSTSVVEKDEMRRFLSATQPSESDLLIGEKLVVIISFNPHSPSAVVLEDEELINGFQTYFDNLWNLAQ